MVNIQSLSITAYKLRTALPSLPNWPIEVYAILWVLLIWGWGYVLNLTSESVDLVILAFTAVPAVFLFWSKPEYGVVALMFFASGFLEPDFVDIRIPGAGGFEMRDLLLMLLFGLTFFRGLSRRNLTIPWWPVGGLMTLFMAFVFFSAFYALRIERVATNWALADLRILLFYLAFFITAWTITTKRALYTVIIGSFAVADITSGIVIIQQYLGPHNYLIESMNDGSWAVYAENGATRVLPPGIVFMYFMMLFSMTLMVYNRHDAKRLIFWAIHTGFSGISMLLTFTRSSWIASGIAILIIVIILFPTYRPHLARIFILGAATLMLLGGSLGILLQSTDVEIPVVEGLIDRFASIFTPGDTLATNSLQWRLFEFQEATKAIKKQPLTGVGLGNSYRNITHFQGEAKGWWTNGDISFYRIDRFTRYAHSSYLAITVKMGIPAMIVLMWACLAFMWKSAQLFMKIPDGFEKALVLAAAPGLIGLLQWSSFHAQLFLAGSTSVIGLIFGIIAGVHNIYVRRPKQTAAADS